METAAIRTFWRLPQPLILASASAGRQHVLREAAIPFEAIPADVDERAIEASMGSRDPDAIAQALARAKAAAVSARAPGRFVLGADQVASCEGRLFGKPASMAAAADLLRFLSARRHRLLPRAALRAGDIAQSADFFSFGTNDLTQTTLGISRDDSGSFLGVYVEKGLLAADPFVTIDQEGVGELIALACQRARMSRPDVALGVCGEHAGDPVSVAFFEKVGIDYISCSPFRVPIARLAAAQAALGGAGTPGNPVAATA